MFLRNGARIQRLDANDYDVTIVMMTLLLMILMMTVMMTLLLRKGARMAKFDKMPTTMMME